MAVSIWGELVRTILVDINDVLGTTDGGTIAVSGVVVSTVELVQNQSSTVTADVLDISQLVLGNEVAGRVTRVGGQKHLSTPGNLLGDLVRVDVVVVLLRQRDGDRSDLEQPNVSNCASQGSTLALLAQLQS